MGNPKIYLHELANVAQPFKEEGGCRGVIAFYLEDVSTHRF